MESRVLVLGAGFGGLEVCARLSEELGADADVVLIDAGGGFTFGFSKLEVMFGRQPAAEALVPYSSYQRSGITFVNERIVSIDPVARSATTVNGTYSADTLVIALGAGYDMTATPGLTDLGLEFYSVAGAEHVGAQLPTFTGGNVVIGVCGLGYKCPPAPHECALLLHDWLTERGLRETSTITVVSPLPVPLPPAPGLSNAFLDRYSERGITFIGSSHVTSLERTNAATTAVLHDGTRLPTDLFLGVPVHQAPQFLADAGLLEDGWIPVERGSGRTRFPDVYAVGDVTSVGTAKAGVFAERAAAVVADQLIARLRGGEEPPGYDGTGACFVELGHGEVGGVHVDFFSGEHPHGEFTDPADVPPGVKDDFGATRRTRWFGLRA